MHELKRIFVVRLVVHDHQADLFCDAVLPHVVNHQVDHAPAVLAPRKGHVDLGKVVEYEFDALICSIVHVHTFAIYSPHFNHPRFVV